jgi:signal transduction histidine kinase
MEEKPLEKSASLPDEQKAIIQKFITLGQLTASISHELKNLLISIKGYCDLIEEKVKNKDSFQIELEEVKKTSELAQKIFMELLRFSKSSGKDEGVSMKTNEIVEETLLILQSIKNVAFIKNFSPVLPPFPLNPQKIKQVLINVILNGIDAMAGVKDKRITITTGELPLGHGIFVGVQDAGEGMSEDVVKKLFHPFFTTKEKGTGLGLSVCRDIMKEHNGYIHVQSEPAKGSIFTLVFLYSQFKSHPGIIDL